MALEPAGVSLTAEGLGKYIRDLDKIEKKNREVFDTQFKGTGKSFQEITKLAKVYKKELDDIAKAERKAAKEAEKRLEKQAREQARQRQARRGAVGQIIGGVPGAALAGGPLGLAVAGATAVNEFIKESIELSKVQAAAEAQLAAAIRSTGGAAGLTASELKAQASALQEVTNFGDEATIQAQAQLLTFTKIGTETFPRATKAILDLATRMDGDLTGAVVQVGKALNDPIAGVSALTRSGVQFSAAQKELIKDLVETNRIADAQAIILAELETQFGGSAEAARQADGGAIALANSFGDLQEEVGDVSRSLAATFETAETGIKIIGFLQDRIKTLQQVLAFAGAGVSAFGTILRGTFERALTTAQNIGRVFKGEAIQPIKTFSQILDEAGENAIAKFKELATIFGETFDDEPIEAVNEDIKEATVNIDAYTKALQQAQNLQLSFARAAEDAARKLARANEDVARRQQRSVTRLDEKQAKDRQKLLDDQIKELANFDADRRKQIADAEDDIRKERKRADNQRKRDQQRLHRKLQQERDRFNLSQVQSERRFQLSESRLRAEGDILALKELREDRALERQEEKENFDLSQRERKADAKDQAKEQERDFKDRIKDLKADLEDRRAELLKSFDEQLAQQQQAQAEAREEQQRGFAEAAEDRAIALAREEEDRRISQRRQLEDLGISLAEQKDVTKEGALRIAKEIEKVFGVEGVADNIITGFTTRTKSDFKDLFDEVENIVSSANVQPRRIVPPTRTTGRTAAGAFGGRVGGIPEFQEGGIVPGPIGTPQAVIAHAGETILPTHQRSFTMAAPVIPSQTLEVAMSGGFNVTGAEAAGEATVQAAVEEMTETMRVAIRRLARRN